jgi:hypothetical protein
MNFKIKSTKILIISLFFLLFSISQTCFAADTETIPSADSNKKWTIKFSQDMDTSTATNQSVLVKDSNGNTIDVSLTLESSKTLIVNPPTGGYKAGETYTLYLENNIKSKLGVPLKNRKAFKFKIKNTSYEIENRNGNLVNGGIVSQSRDWIYFIETEKYPAAKGQSYRSLFKMKNDGSSLTQLNSGDTFFINVVGDFIYYYEEYVDASSLVRIKTDGSDYRGTLFSPGYGINALDNWIYTSNYASNAIYKINIDNMKETKLSNDGAISINVVGDWIYYVNENLELWDSEDNNKIYKIKTDGTERTQLGKDSATKVVASGEYLYYINKSDGYNIYKMKTDSSERTKVTSDSVDVNKIKYRDHSDINVVNDYIYYTNLADNRKIYKLKTDGTEKVKLNNSTSENVNILGDWLYYTNLNDGGKLYKMKTDGTENQTVIQ